MMRLRAATPADVGFIVATEQLPGHGRFIGQWTPERHRSAMREEAAEYLIGEDVAGQARGFAILLELDNRHGNIHLQRIAVAEPGHGFGRALLALVTERVFALPLAHRMWFNMFADNHRAHHVYETSGFVLEGRLREARLRADGSRCNSLIFSMLRTEWSSATGSATS